MKRVIAIALLGLALGIPAAQACHDTITDPCPVPPSTSPNTPPSTPAPMPTPRFVPCKPGEDC